MSTTKKRINISLSKDLEKTLARVAERDDMPQATKAEHLIRMALEIEEDDVLSQVAVKRDRGSVRYISHSSAWR